MLMYLHLKDPLVVSGEVPIDFGEGGAALLRFRLTSIDGWMLGRVQPGYDDLAGLMTTRYGTRDAPIYAAGGAVMGSVLVAWGVGMVVLLGRWWCTAAGTSRGRRM